MQKVRVDNVVLSQPLIDKGRIKYLDILRFLATVGVIFLHVSGLDYYLPINQFDWYVAVIGDSSVRWCVPIFVMISGALFLPPPKMVTIQSIYKKYIYRLLGAFIFWAIVYIVFNTIYNSILNKSLYFDYRFIFPEFHLWFLPMLAGVYILIPFLRKIAEDEKLMGYAIIIWLIYLSISFILGLLPSIPKITQLFTLNNIIGYSGYFLLGYYLSRFSLSRIQKTIIYLVGLFGGIITVMGNIIMSFILGASSISFLNMLSPQVIMMAVALFVAVEENESLFKKSTMRIIEYTRRDLFGIYLTHVIWLRIFGNDLFRNSTNHIISLVIITIMIFLFSLYTTKLIRLVPFLKKYVQ